VPSPAADGTAAPELDGPLCRELETLPEILGLFASERVKFVDGAINHEVLVRKQPVPIPQELQGEIEVTPTPQLPRVQVAASQITVLWLRRGVHVGLVAGLEDEKLLP
jgi:hypothetical protein